MSGFWVQYTVDIFIVDASNKNYDLVMGKEAMLIRDVSGVDIYDQLLRYVLIGNTFINYGLAIQAYAYANAYPPDVSYLEVFTNAQNRAATDLLGLWLESTETPTHVASVVPIAPAATQQQSGNYNPSYSAACIPPFQQDLDCGEIPFRIFQVLPLDLHGFYLDNDSIEYESGQD